MPLWVETSALHTTSAGGLATGADAEKESHNPLDQCGPAQSRSVMGHTASVLIIGASTPSQRSTAKDRRPTWSAWTISLFFLHRPYLEVSQEKTALRTLSSKSCLFQCLLQQVAALVQILCLYIWMVYLYSLAHWSNTSPEECHGMIVRSGPEVEALKVLLWLEYLGHVVRRAGLKTSARLVEAMQKFPIPKSVHDILDYLPTAESSFPILQRSLADYKLTCEDTMAPDWPSRS